MTEDELIDYFNEHVLYELLMLRYSSQQLERTTDQLHWNAMFAAFNVSARNLYKFLTKDNNTNVRVSDYEAHCPTFEPKKASPITGTYQKLQSQCFHMGKRRTEVALEKITSERIKIFSQWIESNMQELIGSFNEDFRSKILPKRAELPQTTITYSSGPTGPLAPTTIPAATNHPGLISTASGR
jgi:hypothetical protein